MTTEQRDAFIASARNAILATSSGEDRVHAVPMWFLYQDGEFRILTERDSPKHRNVLRTGRAALCLDDGRFSYVSVEGPVAVKDPVTYEERLALHLRYRAAEEAKRIVDLGGHERMVMLVLRPEKWRYRVG